MDSSDTNTGLAVFSNDRAKCAILYNGSPNEHLKQITVTSAILTYKKTIVKKVAYLSSNYLVQYCEGNTGEIKTRQSPLHLMILEGKSGFKEEKHIKCALTFLTRKSDIEFQILESPSGTKVADIEVEVLFKYKDFGDN